MFTVTDLSGVAPEKVNLPAYWAGATPFRSMLRLTVVVPDPPDPGLAFSQLESEARVHGPFAVTVTLPELDPSKDKNS